MTREQELLVRKALGRLDLARQLIAQIPMSQAMIDAIAHETYYAMLHIADAFLRGEGIRRNTHGGIISAFGEHFVKQKRIPAQYHRYLIAGKGTRETADYHIESAVTLSDAQQQLAHAIEFLELARGQLGDLPS